MVRESGWFSGSHYSLLWRQRDWQDIYKVEMNFPDTRADTDKE